MPTRGSTMPARLHPPDHQVAVTSPAATSPLRLWVYGLALALLAFVQKPGQLVGDTKFDLVVAPGRFMARALEMWDGSGAFGQIQNQAYGYFFPMGPFFWLGEQAHLQMWVVQRLWWTLLLCLAFYGALKVARTLDLGKPWSQVLAAFAYALSCHITTVIGSTSIEAWPSALAPWVLWCVIRGTRGGSERRWAAAAGLLMGACGGVNAAAVLAALPLGVCWIVTRTGRRNWVFLAWWVATTLLATLWWLIPLFLLGAHSFPFLDYIENAPITTLPTGLSDVLGGTSDWVFFYDGAMFPAGHALATTPYLVLDAMVLAAFGLAGIARSDNPHRRFLLLAVVTGVLAVSFGFTGNGHGWFADLRQGWLDGGLAPLRNLHKFDNVLRLPLVLGMAHMLGRLTLTGAASKSVERVAALVAVVAVVATASPWWLPQIAPTGAIESVPGYWRQTADYLNQRDDGTTTLVVPAAGFGLYLWGSPRDDVLQPLMTAPWATRNVIPFAQPGSVVLLDAITQAIESGDDSPHLAQVLAANGIRRVVVRNDLDRLATGAPDPVAVHDVLHSSPGLEKVAAFGPALGQQPADVYPNGVRLASGGGLSGSFPAVEIYEVTLPVSQVQAVPTSSVRLSAGGAPGDGLLDGDTTPSIIGDPTAGPPDARVVLSDALSRREEDFAEVRDVSSATMTSDQSWRLDRPVHQRVMVPDQERWESTVVWRGIEGVTASSSRAWPDTHPPLRRQSAPGAALDDSRATAWRSADGRRAVGQWWQVDLLPGTSVGRVEIRQPRASGVTRLRLSNGTRTLDVAAPEPGAALVVPTGFGASDHLRVAALAVAPGTDLEGFRLSKVTIEGVHPERTVVLPEAADGRAVDTVSLTRDPGTPGCVDVVGALVCRDGMVSLGDDGRALDRTFTVGAPGTFDLGLTGSWAAGAKVTPALMRALPFRIHTTEPAATNARAGALALVDDNLATTWIADRSVKKPELTVSWPRPRTVSRLRLGLSTTAAAVPATEVSVRAGGRTRVVTLGDDGEAGFRPLRGRTFTIRIRASDVGYSTFRGRQVPLTAGVSTLELSRGKEGRDLLDRSTQQFHGRCGTGPSVTVGDTVVRTRYDASLAEVMKGQVALAPCRGRVELAAGSTHLSTRANALLAVDHVRLDRAGLAAMRPAQPLADRTWTNERRVVDVPGASDARLLVVSQNFNDGWSATLGGHPLRAQLVDGWRQGWWLPAGSAGAVTMTYTPQPWYEAGLVAGLAGALVAVALLLVRSRRAPRPATGDRVLPRGVGAVAMVLAGGLLAGWPGAAAAVAVIALLAVWSPAREHAYLLSGGLALVGGAFAAQSRADQLLTYDAWVQVVLTAALAAALPVVSRPKGPMLRRRMKGISIT